MPANPSHCTVLPRRLGPYFAQERRFHSQTLLGAAKTASTLSSHPKPVIARRPSGPSPPSFTPAPEGFQLWTKIKTAFGYGPHVVDPDYVRARFMGHNNPYTSKTKWPPDFSRLSKLEQFRMEKAYRRRSKLKWARPTWNKWTKIVQNVLIYGTIFWWVFFLQMEDDGQNIGTPFEAVSSPVLDSDYYRQRQNLRCSCIDCSSSLVPIMVLSAVQRGIWIGRCGWNEPGR